MVRLHGLFPYTDVIPFRHDPFQNGSNTVERRHFIDGGRAEPSLPRRIRRAA